MRLCCICCSGAGAVEPHHADPCEDCGGSGNQKCESRGCDEDAIGFDEDGRALCEDCLFELMTEFAHD